MVAIVIDDEVLAVEYTSGLLEKAGLTVYSFTNPLKALESDEIKGADVFYLDIEMPEIGGIKLAEEIHAVNIDCEIVFITGHNQYALEAFDVSAIDYLLKPVTHSQVERSLARARKRRGDRVLSDVREADVKSQVNVSLFGKTSVYLDDGSKSLRFMTIKVAEVFCYMLLKRSTAEISKWKLMDDIWPDKDADKSDINMRSTISRLNKTFRENSIQISMKSTRNGYHLDIAEAVEIDAFLLEDIADKNYVLKEDNLLSYEIIMLKYNDLFLEDYDSRWCDAYRTLYHRYFKIAAHKLIEYYRNSQQEPLRILNIIERIIIYEPYDEKLREFALALYYQGYGKAAAVKYYKEYIRVLKEDLDMQPGEKLKKCYRNLIKIF